ncbi:unnamed protein product (macronuclear) [Paramecium tetraurelia]|uniref:Protein kinase domain-containing protein n=1 Tax=Paramecium tetraurelia TaxID=5888 RepID=A0D2C9_PARTE|nr:uncharacterized protein GSPATT00012702001 [Paramecium tetraurelia]CAK77196.1 unnamed protein product [Paramecium tetraurelia]|eukprot:XP_001444593.1 hypothetical protein (macronuclear) [Paramecium tetraurelia strain d4-2]
MNELNILQKIGNGAFSQVYLGTYKSRQVAIKVTVEKQVRFPSYCELFNREVEILEQLQHPNLVKYIASYETFDKLYIIMDYVEGSNLTELSKSNLSEQKIKSIIKQLLIVLTYLHNKDITHRDIKPDNILVGLDGRVRLIDFGLSQQSESKISYDKCGTLLFMAPEMILKMPYLKSVDMWSIGVIQYLLYERKHPFNYENLIESIQQYNVNFTIMDKSAQNFFRKCAAINPEARMSAEQALMHPWITGEGDLGQPITIHDRMTIFQNKQKLICLINALTFIKYCTSFVKAIRLIIPLNEQGSQQEITVRQQNQDPTQRKSTSRIKQARSTSQLFFETNVASPLKKQSPFRITQQRQSQTKQLQHSNSMQLAQMAKRGSLNKLPPLNSSNSPIEKRRTNIRMRQL